MGAIPPAVWVKGDRVDGAEVTLDAANLVLKHRVEEPNLEPLARGRRRDFPRILPTSENNLPQRCTHQGRQSLVA